MKLSKVVSFSLQNCSSLRSLDLQCKAAPMLSLRMLLLLYCQNMPLLTFKACEHSMSDGIHGQMHAGCIGPSAKHEDRVELKHGVSVPVLEAQLQCAVCPAHG